MNGTSEVGLRGPLYAINAVLAQDSGLVYQPQSGYSGPDTLSVTTTEIRPGVTSGLLSDKDDIAITVEAPSGPAADSVIITGKAGQGLLLHASVGALTPVAGRVPDSSELRFQWTSGGAVIARAHTADLILSAEEAGAMISVTVSFTDTRGANTRSPRQQSGLSLPPHFAAASSTGMAGHPSQTCRQTFTAATPDRAVNRSPMLSRTRRQLGRRGS